MAKAKKQVEGDALDVVCAAIRKAHGAGSAVMFGHVKSEVREVIPTGIDTIDKYVLGCGGLPIGRMSEVYSEEGGGKTSFALMCLAACQRAGGIAILADDEVALNEERARVFGVDLDRLIILQSASAVSMEESFNRQRTALESLPDGVGPNLLVWDSLAASAPQAELDGEAGDVVMGVKARLTSSNFPKLLKLLPRKRTHYMVINQTRQKLGVVFGNSDTTPGGKTLKFLASTRIQFFSGAALKNAVGQHIGKAVTVMAAKNRFAPPYRKVRVRLLYATGWDNIWTTVDHAKNLHVIPKGCKVAEGYPRAVEHFNVSGWDAAVLSGEAADGSPDEIAEDEGDGLGD